MATVTRGNNESTVLVVGLLVAGLVLPGAAIAGLGVPGATAPPWVVWKQELVDGSQTVNAMVSLALDAGDMPGIAYQSNNRVAYAIRTGGAWTSSLLPKAVGSPSVTQAASLAFDSQDGAHVSAIDTVNGWTLVYASLSGASWSTEIVDTTTTSGKSTLRFDSDDSPHIAYRDNTNDVAKYAFRNASGWHLETISTAFSTSSVDVSMDLGPDETPHVVWLAPGGPYGSLVYAHRAPNGTWTSEVISSNSGGFHHSLAIDSQGRPHISFDGQAVTLSYGHNGGTGWTITQVDTDSRTGQYNSIAVDANDVPHISYVQHDNFDANDVTRGHVKYATKLPTGQWVTEFADPQDKHRATSIALDSHGLPHVAYQFAVDQDLLAGAQAVASLRYAEPAQTALP